MSGPWHLCQTHGNQEKSLARKLFAAGTDFFLPLAETKKFVWIEKVKTPETKPLFPNYIFLAGDDARKLAGEAREKICIYPMSAKYEPKLVSELEGFEFSLSRNPRLGMEVLKFFPREHVRVVGGPYMGLQDALYDRDSGEDRVWLSTQLFGQRGAPLEIDRKFIEPWC